jgi:hypothetical protein
VSARAISTPNYGFVIERFRFSDYDFSIIDDFDLERISIVGETIIPYHPNEVTPAIVDIILNRTFRKPAGHSLVASDLFRRATSGASQTGVDHKTSFPDGW